MKKIVLTLIPTIALLFGELKTISADDLIKMQAKGVPVIDIRTKGEWRDRGVIDGAKLITFFSEKGEPQTPSFMFQLGHLVKDKDSAFIIYCAHANRTKSLGNWLTKSMGFKKVYELNGGIEYGWIDKKQKVIKP